MITEYYAVRDNVKTAFDLNKHLGQQGLCKALRMFWKLGTHAFQPALSDFNTKRSEAAQFQ
jgi:hypothetical protein